MCQIVQARERVCCCAQAVSTHVSMVEDFVTVFPESRALLAINGQRRPTIDSGRGRCSVAPARARSTRNYMLLELDQHRLNVNRLRRHQLGTVQEMKAAADRAGRAPIVDGAGGRSGTYETERMPFDQVHPGSAGPWRAWSSQASRLPMKLPAALPKTPIETIRGQ